MGDARAYSLLICFCLLIFASQTSSQLQPKCPFNYIYHLGDGVADNGNAIRTPFGRRLPAAHFPYGITYPSRGRSTGCWSDGRLIIDYAATAIGLTQVKPYLERYGNSSNGVNFAVNGSPVLDRSFYESKRVRIPSYVAPLSTQLDWFRQYLQSSCSNSADCIRIRLADSLFAMGDVEGNDIRYPLLQGKSIQDIQTNYIPFVIQTLINCIREVIRAGVIRIIIPENVPLGCYPSILSAFPSNDPSSYDDLGCLKSVNDLVVFRNNMLQTALIPLRLEFPFVTMITVPYYTVVQLVLRQATLHGFDSATLLKACCGTGGQYDYDERRFCGSLLVLVCPKPNEYIHWDGVHLTQEAHLKISEILTPGLLPALRCF